MHGAWHCHPTALLGKGGTGEEEACIRARQRPPSHGLCPATACTLKAAARLRPTSTPPSPSPLPPPKILLCTQAQDGGAGALDPEAQLRKEQEAEEARRAELRAHGTPVTPEAFRAWQQAFETEQGLSAASLGAVGQSAGAAPARVTGKQFFKMQEARHVEVRLASGIRGRVPAPRPAPEHARSPGHAR